MNETEWILTFDDGPLPADVSDVAGLTDEQLLAPLVKILHHLRRYGPQPLQAVFYLRGPGFPWNTPPRRCVYARGVERILAERHHVGIHCYNHDPHIWWNSAARRDGVIRDLDRWVEYFQPMLTEPVRVLRPAYGACEQVIQDWAEQNGVRVHMWDMDTQDWVHHDDATVQSFVDEPEDHLRHIRETIGEFIRPTENCRGGDILMHVSKRTADHLPEILDCIAGATRSCGQEPRFHVPSAYLS